MKKKKIKLPFDLQLDLAGDRHAYSVEPLLFDSGDVGFDYLCAKGLGELWELPVRLPQTMWFHITDNPHPEASYVRPVYYHNWDEDGCPFSGLLFENSLGYLLFPHRMLAKLLEALCSLHENYGLFVSLQYEEEFTWPK